MAKNRVVAMREQIERKLEHASNDGTRPLGLELVFASLGGGVGLVLSLVLLVVLTAFNLVLPVFPPILMLWAFGIGFSLTASTRGLWNIQDQDMTNTLLWGGGLATFGAVIGSIVGFFIFPVLGSLLGTVIGTLIGGSLGVIAALVTGLCADFFIEKKLEEQEQLAMSDATNQFGMLGDKCDCSAEEESTEGCFSRLFHPSHEPHVDSSSHFMLNRH